MNNFHLEISESDKLIEILINTVLCVRIFMFLYPFFVCLFQVCTNYKKAVERFWFKKTIQKGKKYTQKGNLNEGNFTGMKLRVRNINGQTILTEINKLKCNLYNI